MKLTSKQTSFGTAFHSLDENGKKRLVAEYFIPKKGLEYRVKVNEPEYGQLMIELGYNVSTIIDSHTGKPNWVCYMPINRTSEFEAALAQMDLVHRQATREVLDKRASRTRQLAAERDAKKAAKADSEPIIDEPSPIRDAMSANLIEKAIRDASQQQAATTNRVAVAQ